MIYTDLSRCHSALGTPLDWPEAKKKADHVRGWGIEVGQVSLASRKPGIDKSKATASHMGTRQRQREGCSTMGRRSGSKMGIDLERGHAHTTTDRISGGCLR